MAEEFGELKAEVGKTFDEVLSEVSTAIASMPLRGAVAISLPGVEAARPSEPVVEAEDPPLVAAPHTINPNQQKLGLWASIEADEPGESEDDPIAAFAPDPNMDWGPSKLKATRRGARRRSTEGR